MPRSRRPSGDFIYWVRSSGSATAGLSKASAANVIKHLVSEGPDSFVDHGTVTGWWSSVVGQKTDE